MKKEVSRVDRIIAWVVDCMLCGALSYFVMSLFLSTWQSIHEIAAEVTIIYIVFFSLLIFKDYINHYVPFLFGEKISNYKIKTDKPIQLITKNFSLFFGPVTFFYFLTKKRVFFEKDISYIKKEQKLFFLLVYWFLFLFLSGYIYDGSNKLILKKNNIYSEMIKEIEKDGNIKEYSPHPRKAFVATEDDKMFLTYIMKVCNSENCTKKTYKYKFNF